jgi:multidrug efflux pump subunit AcrA (membrane-fusion protein)
MNRNRLWLVLIVLVLVIGGFFMLRPKGTQPTQTAAPTVQLATAQRKPFDVHVLVHGRVGPPPGSTASLAFAVPGRIAGFLVRVGQRVRAGDALVQLDATTYALAVAQARGDLQAGTYGAQSSLAAAQAQVRQGQLRIDAGNAARRRE